MSDTVAHSSNVSPLNPVASDIEHDVPRRMRDVFAGMDALGDAVRALSTQASPQSARSVQATENVVRKVEAEFGLLTSAEVGALLGSSSRAARNLAGERHRAGELIAIKRGSRLRFPGYQFNDDGSVRVIVAALLDKVEQHGRSESGLFLWMVKPTGRLHGRRPVDVLLEDSVDADQQLLEVADLTMPTEW